MHAPRPDRRRLDEMCANLAAHGDRLANPLTAIPARMNAPSPGHEPSSRDRGIWHRQPQSPGRDLAVGVRPHPVRRVAHSSSRGAPVHRSARRAAPRRNPAPERHTAQTGAAPDGHHRPRRAEPARRARLSERAALPADAAPGSGSDRPGQPVWLDYLQMRQQSLAETALQEGRVVTRRQESRDR